MPFRRHRGALCKVLQAADFRFNIGPMAARLCETLTGISNAVQKQLLIDHTSAWVFLITTESAKYTLEASKTFCPQHTDPQTETRKFEKHRLHPKTVGSLNTES